jgi:hypothetical protein
MGVLRFHHACDRYDDHRYAPYGGGEKSMASDQSIRAA